MEQQEKNKAPYVEVIGDTVYGKHLIITISLSIASSLIAFFIGKQIFPRIAPEQMVESYSLLLGIAGSLIALLINTLLFKPKRTLNESPNTSAELSAVYRELQFDIEEEREAILNDPVTAQEMKNQGIYDMFMEEEREEQKWM